METTLNIRNDIFEKITMASGSMGMSHSDLIIVLIKKLMEDIKDPGRMGSLVQYQERRGRGHWHKFHICLRVDDYEYFLDLKKLLKMSLSLILAYAVKKFLNKQLKRNDTDNNRYRNYMIAKEIIDNIVCWKFIWGFPPNLEKLILQDCST